MKILISADIEGITGVSGPGFKDESSSDYTQACELMTTEINKVVSACFDNGASEVNVVDGHGSGKNLLLNKLDSRAKSIDKNKSELRMMAGIEDADVCIFVGYHGMANKQNSFCAHTSSSKTVAKVTINGEEVNEGQINALIAKNFGKKLILLIGTDTAVKEIKKNVPSVEFVITKKSIGIHQSEHSSIDVVYDEIQRKVKIALSKIDEINFTSLSEKNTTMAVSAPYAFFLEGLDTSEFRFLEPRTVEFKGENILECYQKYRQLLKHMSQKSSEWLI